tara:strand:+ start:547 stop:1323 length:777 start_codon:yes stop_codon:yes gene_type:complete
MKLVYIPDTQVRKGVPTNHILAAGKYIVKHKPNIVVVGGDWWDMPSCNNYASAIEIEGQRVLEDLKAGKEAMDLFMSPLVKYNARMKKNAKKQYKPRLIFTTGNHDPEVRLPRLVESNPILEGLDLDDTRQFLENYGFEVYRFLEVVNIEGIRFSHFHVNPHSAKKGPLGGAIDTMLKNAGFSFVQGHCQGLKMGKHYLADGTKRLGIVAGSFYQHDEAFMGIQGNEHWHGIIHLNEVSDGGADICEISLKYLLDKYL